MIVKCGRKGLTMVRCPKCKEEDYTIIDVIDNNMDENTVIEKGEAVCDNCGCRFLVRSFYTWEKDEFLCIIE